MHKICGNAIEVVTSWPHLGHIISDDCDDKLDILSRRCSFIGQANNLLCVFGKLDCSVKTKLLKSYCFSFYGCELWDLHNVILMHCVSLGVKLLGAYGICRTTAMLLFLNHCLSACHYLMCFASVL